MLVALLVPPTETKGIFLTAVKALYGWSNNHLLARADDYFGLDASLNPFLHTWTLGVEEQFYLVFPLLMAALGMHRRRALPLLAGTIGLSLAFSLWWTAQAADGRLLPDAQSLLGAGAGWGAAAGPAPRPAGGLDRWSLAAAGRDPDPAGSRLLFTSESQGFPAPGALPAVLGTLMVLQASPGPDGRFLPVPLAGNGPGGLRPALLFPLSLALAGDDADAMDGGDGPSLADAPGGGCLLPAGLAGLQVRRATGAHATPCRHRPRWCLPWPPWGAAGRGSTLWPIRIGAPCFLATPPTRFRQGRGSPISYR